MKIILVYDIAIDEKKDNIRLGKARKIARKYLHHIQKSVFEGELTYAKLVKLEYEITQILDLNRDSVIIYSLADGVKVDRKIITKTKDPTDNIL